MASIEIVGDKELERELKELAATSARSIMRPAINAGLTPIKKRAVSLAKSNFKSDTIAKEIGKSVKKARRRGGITGMVYVKPQPERMVKVNGREVPFEVVANILEFGRKDGSLPARSFMRKAREETKSEALRIVKEKAKITLEKKWREGKVKLK